MAGVESRELGSFEWSPAAPEELDYEAKMLGDIAASEAAFAERVQQGAADLARAVRMLNRWIVATDRVLWRLQPPATGRIRVQWDRKSGSDGRSLTPILVRWKKVRGGWQTERLGPRAENSVTRWGGFERHADEVRDAVLLAKRLIAKRSDVVKRGRDFQLSGSERARSGELMGSRAQEELERIVEEANGRMREADEPLDLSYVLTGEWSA
ncbi:hypothetical protein [Thioalkalivibrio sp. ALgr3]|uniref:hypothetical protein n=1 Tax=Thioalkalivibrio sp. ALgr3 TaxID=1239292 RepID=UPI0003709FC8|nr:hypothetical protein [Thioalkalivibrio sp. ALgr3]